jgi:hypothetical protein
MFERLTDKCSFPNLATAYYMACLRLAERLDPNRLPEPSIQTDTWAVMATIDGEEHLWDVELHGAIIGNEGVRGMVFIEANPHRVTGRPIRYIVVDMPMGQRKIVGVFERPTVEPPELIFYGSLPHTRLLIGY